MITFLSMGQFLCHLKNHDFLDFFMPKFSKDFGAKKSGKSWILKTHNFWSKRRNIIGNGAKHIYFIQRIHWKNFQVWVLRKNSSQESNDQPVKTRFFTKFWFFNFFQRDEFFQVWVLTCQNSWFWSKLTLLKP